MMGTFYELFAEAKVDNRWVGIDLYVHTSEGWRPVPLVSGKSDIGSAISWYHDDIQIYPSELSDELKRDHHWYVEQEEEGWQGTLVSVIEGKNLLLHDFSKPEHCGFVDRESILMHERDGVQIEEWLTGKELAELPPEARSGYQWYEWTECGGDLEIMRNVYDTLLTRIDAFNTITQYEMKCALQDISIADCRVVIFRS